MCNVFSFIEIHPSAHIRAKMATTATTTPTEVRALISVGQLSALLVPQRDPNLVLVTTLRDPDASDFLIEGTLPAAQEVAVMERLARSPVGRVTAHVVVYGNSEEDAAEVFDKYRRVRAVGFENVRVFLGGLFRWLSMRFFFQADQFPCTYTARAIQEIGLPPPSITTVPAPRDDDAAHLEIVAAQDAYARVLGVRLLSSST